MRRMNIVAGVVIIASLAGGVVYYRQAEEKKDVQPPVLHAESEEFISHIFAPSSVIIISKPKYL